MTEFGLEQNGSEVTILVIFLNEIVFNPTESKPVNVSI